MAFSEDQVEVSSNSNKSRKRKKRKLQNGIYPAMQCNELKHAENDSTETVLTSHGKQQVMPISGLQKNISDHSKDNSNYSERIVSTQHQPLDIFSSTEAISRNDKGNVRSRKKNKKRKKEQLEREENIFAYYSSDRPAVPSDGVLKLNCQNAENHNISNASSFENLKSSEQQLSSQEQSFEVQFDDSSKCKSDIDKNVSAMHRKKKRKLLNSLQRKSDSGYFDGSAQLSLEDSGSLLGHLEVTPERTTVSPLHTNNLHCEVPSKLGNSSCVSDTQAASSKVQCVENGSVLSSSNDVNRSNLPQNEIDGIKKKKRRRKKKNRRTCSADENNFTHHGSGQETSTLEQVHVAKHDAVCSESCTSPNKRQEMDVDVEEDIQRQRCCLPIYSSRSKLIKIFRAKDYVIIKGETACGKTTQIPQYILEAGLARKKAIVVTQPRRVAAISIAKRVAQEMGTTLGDKVGYSVRFDDMTSQGTKIKYATDGMLLRESISDPLLTSYSWVILDEAHERTLHTDILFGVVKTAVFLRQKRNVPPLKVIIMSATIEEDVMSKYFNNAPVYSLRGRDYSIKVFNAGHEHNDYFAAALSTVFQIHENEEAGDILVFLTGEEEIECARAETLNIMPHVNRDDNVELYPMTLYASLPSAKQLQSLCPSRPGTRKVIYSTNIAETSLTIPGVKFVVDTGMVKCKTYNSVGGLDVLKVERISKAQADQRCGRAGRESDGSCYRLYTVEQYQNFKDFPIPEIKRCSLAGVLLQIIAIGIRDVKNFDFLDKPSDENVDTAISQLRYLGAIIGDDCDLALTECGKIMVKFPLDPRFSKTIISSQKYKCTDEVLTIISLLSTESVFLSISNPKVLYKEVRKKFSTGEGDHIMLLNFYRVLHAMKFSAKWCLRHSVSYRGIKKAVEIRKQLSLICQKAGIKPCSSGNDTSLIRKCLATGLFMNSAQLVGKKVYRTMHSNQRVFIHPSSVLFHARPSCCIYTDLIETSKCYMRNVSVVDEEWLEEVAPHYFQERQLRHFSLQTV